MLITKPGFPEEDELVICTVTAVHFHSVFVKLDEYEKTGLIHISEISPGRIRNIRDYVSEGKKIVCKVLHIDTDKGHIDLSLRRVNESQKRNKVNEVKKEQAAEKMVEFSAKKLNLDPKQLYKELFEKTQKDYPTVYSFFEATVDGSASLKELDLAKEVDETLTTLIKDRIVPQKIKISGKLKLVSYDPNGIDIIKKSLIGAKNIDNVEIRYEGTGKYNIQVESDSYKEAEKILEKAVHTASEPLKKTKGIAEFARQE
jgi:translation initiation factor 2 subunit 1